MLVTLPRVSWVDAIRVSEEMRGCEGRALVTRVRHAAVHLADQPQEGGPQGAQDAAGEAEFARISEQQLVAPAGGAR